MTADGGTAHIDRDLRNLRARIDRLDADLQAMLLERLDRSRQVQTLRGSAGQGGLQPRREAAVVAGYVDALGPHGHDVAAAILLLCRGHAGAEAPGQSASQPPSTGT